MNAEAQKLMDTINRLMAKGMSRDDDTIKTLEGLIAEELSKGETDDAFLQRPAQDPRVQRPGMKQFRLEDFEVEDDADKEERAAQGLPPRGPGMEMDKGGNLTPEEYERQNPNWREKELAEDLAIHGTQDEQEQHRMIEDYDEAPEGFKIHPRYSPPGFHGPAQYKNTGPFPALPASPFEPRAHHGFRDIPFILSEVANPATENLSDRRSFQRPSAGPSTETELNTIQEQMTPEEFERQNPDWRERERAEDQRTIDEAEEGRMMRDFIARPEEHGKYPLGRQWMDESPGVFKAPYRYTTPMPPAHYGFDNIQGILEADQPLGRQPGRGSFQRPQAGLSTEEELEMIMKGAEDAPIYEDEYE